MSHPCELRVDGVLGSSHVMGPLAYSVRLQRSLAAHGVCGGVDWGLWLREIASRGEPRSKLKLGATGYGYLGPSTTPKLTGKREQGLTQPERHTRRAWISAPSVTELPWPTSSSRPRC